MSDYLVTDTELTAIADAIRTKGGTSASLSFPTEFVSAIEAISTGGNLVYEEGEETPTTDKGAMEVLFSGTHTEAPWFVVLWDKTLKKTDAVATYWWCMYFSAYKLLGAGVPPYSSTEQYYGQSWNVKHFENKKSDPVSNTNYTSFSDSYDSTSGSTGNAVYNTGFKLSDYTSACKYKAGRTYKWIAIWK